MITTDDRESINDIEVASEEPKINAMRQEIDRALTDLSGYYYKNQCAYDYWHACWPGQTVDGRKHSLPYVNDEPFPWENSSDTRVRLAERLVRQHVSVAKTAFFNAKAQATAVLPFINGAQASQGTQLLKWMIYSHMRPQLLCEIPLAFAWKYGYGASIISPEWEQEERLDEHEISLPIIDQLIQAKGGPPSMIALQDALANPNKENQFVQLIMTMSDVVTVKMARGIVKDLRELRTAQIPVRYTYKSQPRWTALRIGVDVLFPKYARDLQRERWVARRERVSRVDLENRIETEEYSDKFVEELLKHKGEMDSPMWLGRTATERSVFGSSRLMGYPMSGTADDAAYRDSYELFHVFYKATDMGVPCLYKTTFNPIAVGNDRANPLYATHGKFGYDHGEYPFIPLRAETSEPEIMSSRGIPEITYTWENEIKVQRDARTDLTALDLRPPLIVPYSRQNTILNQPLPGAVIGVTRPNEFQWMPTPPPSARSVEIEMGVLKTAEEFFGLFGVEVDPDWKTLRRQEVVNDTLGEMCLVIDQTFQLMQQFEADDEVAKVVGPLARPFHVDRETIQSKHEISAVYDARMLDEEYGAKKLQMIVQALQLDQTGRWDMSELSAVALEIIDPSIAARLLKPPQDAADQEVQSELGAVSGAMSGIETPPPMHGNHQLRLQTLVGSTFQSPNPGMQKRLAQQPDSVAILQNRIKFYQNQIQQMQQNPQIGRTLATGTFDPKQALPTTQQTVPLPAAA